jgi:hypothetical protein
VKAMQLSQPATAIRTATQPERVIELAERKRW